MYAGRPELLSDDATRAALILWSDLSFFRQNRRYKYYTFHSTNVSCATCVQMPMNKLLPGPPASVPLARALTAVA